MAEITVKGFRCENPKCRHEWRPVKFNGNPPKVCPRCKRDDWNTARGE